MTGIVSYGYYIPKYRIKIDDLARVWGKNPEDIKKSLNIFEKAVSGPDEDAVSMAYESASMALKNVKIKKEEIKAIFFGSETPPYAVNPASTILADFLDISGNQLASDTQFACKAATGAMIFSLALIKSGFTNYAVVSASDKATGKPHDALEYTAGSGSVSLLLGSSQVAVEIIDAESFSTDTPDFWRREGIRYPSHSGRFTGKPSYFYHIQKATEIILKKNNLKPSDFKYAVFHMPNGKFPVEVGISLGFKKKQIEDSLVVSTLGNSYTASALMGLVSVLERAKENDMIFVASYGSGAGSDSFILKVNKNIEKVRVDFKTSINEKHYLDYTTYLKYMNIL